MRVHKKIMGISLILMIFCGIIALVLEVSCKNKGIDYCDFIINLMLGIFASSLVTLVVSYLSYKIIWSESLNDYILAADEIFYENAFFYRYLISIMNDGNITLEECVSDEMLNKISNIQLELKKIDGIVRRMSIIKVPIKIPFAREKKRKIYEKIIEHYDMVSDYSIAISQVEKYILFVRVNKEEGWKRVVDELYRQLKIMIKCLDEGDNTLYSAHNDLQQEFFSYYNIKE